LINVDPQFEFHASYQLSEIYDFHGDKEQAIELKEHAFIVLEWHDRENKVPDLMLWCSRFQTGLGNYDVAKEILQKRLDTVELTGDFSILSSTYRQLGYIADIEHKHDNAAQYFVWSIEWAEKTDDLRELANSYEAAASSPGNNRNYNNSLELFQKALQFFGELGEEKRVGEIKSYIEELRTLI